MLRPKVIASILVAALAVLISGCSSYGSSGSGSSNPYGGHTAHKHSPPPKPKAKSPKQKGKTSALAVHITTTAAVWGSVQVRYTMAGATKTAGTCTSTSCSYHVPAGATVQVSQTPTSSATWPFQNWTLTNAGHTSHPTGNPVSFKMSGNASVSATYILKM